MFDDFERLAFVWGHAVPLIISLLCASGKKQQQQQQQKRSDEIANFVFAAAN